MISGRLRCCISCLSIGRRASATVRYNDHVSESYPLRAHRTNLNAMDMLKLEVNVPFVGEVHRRGVRFLTLYEADAHNIPVLVLQEESDTLEPAGIPSPSSRARHAARELFRAVTVGHAPSKLQLGLQRARRIGVAGGFLGHDPHSTVGRSCADMSDKTITRKYDLTVRTRCFVFSCIVKRVSIQHVWS